MAIKRALHDPTVSPTTVFEEKVMKVKLEFTTTLLGATPKDPDIYTNFIASKAPDAETAAQEIARVGVTEAVDSKTSGFLLDDDGSPALKEHVVKGFFQSACKSIRRINGSKQKYESGKLSAYKEKIKDLIFIYPRYIPLIPPADADEDQILATLQRPLRAETAQGERIALASSETMPEGTTMEFEIHLMDEQLEPAVREWLDYGRYKGMGEWRNAGHGRFEWMEITDEA